MNGKKPGKNEKKAIFSYCSYFVLVLILIREKRLLLLGFCQKPQTHLFCLNNEEPQRAVTLIKDDATTAQLKYEINKRVEKCSTKMRRKYATQKRELVSPDIQRCVKIFAFPRFSAHNGLR